MENLIFYLYNAVSEDKYKEFEALVYEEISTFGNDYLKIWLDGEDFSCVYSSLEIEDLGATMNFNACDSISDIISTLTLNIYRQLERRIAQDVGQDR